MENITRYLKPSQMWPRHVLTAQVMFALFVPLFSLPPFHIGLWFQSEPVNFALYFTSFILALTLAHPCFHAQLLRVLKHPAVWSIGALFAWSLIASPFADFPIKSLQGNPETGQGAMWFLALFLWVIAYILAANTPLKRMMVLGALGLVTLVIFVLQNFQSDAAWFVVKWPDFQAFMGLFVFITITAKLGHKGWKAWVVAYAIGALLVYISESRAAYLCYFLLMPALVAFFALLLSGRFAFLEYFKRHINAVAGFILVFGVVIYVVLSFPSEHYYNDDYADPTQKSEAQFAFYYGSVGTRMLFNKIALDAMAADPGSFLTGQGWGHYADGLFRHTFRDKVSATSLVDRYGHDAPNWFMVQGTAFHSHNSHIEVLYSTGVVGLVLSLIFFVKVMPRITNLQRAMIAAAWIATSALLSIWFILAIVTIYFAIAAAFSVQMDIDKPQPEEAKHYWPALSLVCILLAVILAVSALTQRELAIRGKAYSDSIQLYTPDMVGQFGDDYGQGGHHLWWIYASLVDYIDQKRNHNILVGPERERLQKIIKANEQSIARLSKEIAAKEKAGLTQEAQELKDSLDGHALARDDAKAKMPEFKVVSQGDVVWFMYLLDQVERLALAGDSNAKVKQVMLEAYNRLHTRSDEAVWDEAKERTRHKWAAMLWWFAVQEPERVDLLKAYYAHFVDQMPQMKDVDKVQDALDELALLMGPIMLNFPDEPVSVWYRGMAMQYMVGKAEDAVKYMARALELGVEKHVRIWPATKAAVEQAVAKGTTAAQGIENEPQAAQ